MFAEPLAGWREVRVRPTKTKIDWAVEMARLLEGRYAGCPQVILVCDNPALPVEALRKGRQYVRFPRRAAICPIPAAMPRRATEIVLTGVPHQAR